MSWAAHDLEPYIIQKHLGKRVAFMPLLLGSYAPDMFTKWFVYGIGFSGWHIKASDPARFHRGWPGVGFTHSLPFGVLLALAIYGIWRKPVIAYSFLIGQWAHALTDTGDTVGTMLFFPFTTHLFAIGAWAYAGQLGRQVDAGAYFSGLGFVWDGIWLTWAVFSWRVLTREYFRREVLAGDPFFSWAGRTLSEGLLLAAYRSAFFYGACRWVAWSIWAHVVHSFKLDISWGGPHWVKAIQAQNVNAAACNCPCCRASRPTFAIYGAIILAVRVEKLRARFSRYADASAGARAAPNEVRGRAGPWAIRAVRDGASSG
jgi:LexA-binding, inner membrane-associated putative hydrolase